MAKGLSGPLGRDFKEDLFVTSNDKFGVEALTFDDVLLLPGYSTVLPRDVDVSTYLTRNIRLNIPLLSA